MLYILKSDTPELEYQIFGIYENLNKLLKGANDVFKVTNGWQISFKTNTNFQG